MDKNEEEKRNRLIATVIGGLSGAGAGAVASFFTAPLDMVRVRMQADPVHSSRYTSTVSSMKIIFKEEGILGFYKGVGPSLYALIPNWGVYFSSYNFFKEHYQIEFGMTEGPLLHIISAMSAGVTTDIITNPIWLVKTRLQTQIFHPTSVKYHGTFDAFRKIVHEEGLFALWNGATAQLIGVAHVAVQFPLYEATKKYLMEYRKKSHNSLTTLDIIFCSSLSKLIASTVAYPHEVLRSRMQSQRKHKIHYTSTWHAISSIAKNEGIRGFYRGIEANLIRTVPAAAITFTAYELFSRYIKQLIGAAE